MHAEITEGQDLTHGNLARELWSLAWPMMLSVFFYTLYNLVDAFWVSKVSDVAIAAVSISQITLFVMVALSMGLNIGSSVIMAMRIGAKKITEAEEALGQSFVLSAAAGVFFTVICLVFMEPLLVLSGAQGMILEPAREYFTITAGGSILFFVLMNIMFAFNSQGDTFTLTKLFAVSTVVNVVLDPVLIFGLNLGISGAGWATLVSQVVFIWLAVRSLSSEHRMVRFRYANLRVRWESVKEVLQIGVPASLTQVINPVSQAALLYIISVGFAEAGSIAYSIGTRIEFFAFLPAVGFGFGAMALIGQNMGAGNMKRARESYELALKMAFGGAAGLGVLAILFGRFIVNAFSSDPTVVGYSLSYIWIVGITYGLLAAMMVEANAFQAMGKSWPGFWIFVVRFVVVSIPLAYGLTQWLGMGIEGVWIGVAGGNVLAAVLGYVWVRRVMK